MKALLFTKKPDDDYGEPQTWECGHPPVEGERIQHEGRWYKVTAVFVDTTPGETSVYAVEEES